jgi:diguanylate cyclase
MPSLLELARLLLALGAGGALATFALAAWRREGGEDHALEVPSDTLSRIRELTSSVAEQFDQHASEVEQINAELSAAGTADAGVLLAVARLVAANERMQQQLDVAEEKLQAQARQLETQAVEVRTDPLTDLANRRALDDVLSWCLDEYRRRQRPASLMLLDVDHFKRLNDTHGHQAGDEVLKSVARLLRQSLGDADIVARYGGEEFAVVFGGCGIQEASQQAERARQAIAASPIVWQGQPLRVSASAGVSEIRAGDDQQRFVRRADEALYAAKRLGRDRGHWHDGRKSHVIKLHHDTERRPDRASAPVPQGEEVVSFDDRFIGHLPSKRTFLDKLAARLADAQRDRSPLSVVALQIDDFRRHQSEQGPVRTATIARVVAQLTMATVRGMDEVTRMADDTFAVLLPATRLDDALRAAERLRRSVERCALPKSLGGLRITASFGVTEVRPSDDPRSLLDRCRAALQQAVKEGRNRVSA